MMNSGLIKICQSTLIAAALLITSPAAAQDWTQYQYSFFIESSTSPIQIKGMKDVHVSDWEFAGTGSSEGRMALPLSGGNTNNPLMPGAKMGFAANVTNFLDLTLDFSINFGSMMVLTLNGGADFYLVEIDNFRMGAMVRIGYMLASMNAGQAQMLTEDYRYQYIHIDDVGNFYNGDIISAEMNGVVTQAGIVNEFYITPELGIRIEAGFQFAYIDSLTIVTGTGENRVELSINDPAVVQAVDDNTSAEYTAPAYGTNDAQPQGRSLGLMAGIGFVFRY